MAVQELAPPKQKDKQDNRWYPPPQGKWSYTDYLQLPDGNMRYEVIGGNLTMSPAPRPNHQFILGELFAHFREYVKKNQLGRVVISPIDVVMSPFATPVQPDLLFINKDNLGIITKTRIEGVPDLVIEVLSPGSVAHDTETKFKAYADAGIKEYWIVDAENCTIQINVLRGQAYAPLGRFSGDEEAFSELLSGFKVQVSEICA
jgi:Uma2 family endonuclease